MGDLLKSSVEIILANQHPSGAYVASPNFAPYRYCWFRDGAFIAYSMDLVGEHTSAARFHMWASEAIKRRKDIVRRATHNADRGQPSVEGGVLHTRYTVEGDEAGEEWQNFQLDGFGSWLWSLEEHVEMCNDIALLEQMSESIDLTVRYLLALWKLPNYNCWEEHPDELHPYTLSAIYGGLRAVDRLATQHGVPLVRVDSGLVERIRGYVLGHGVRGGHLIKRFRPPEGRQANGEELAIEVDASLVGCATPYRLLPPDDPIMLRTVERIETELHCPGSGVHRYLADTYYGGGEWVLLAAWLGWYYAEIGKTDEARELRCWVEAQADADGSLPEQVSTHLLSPEHYHEWAARWGPLAKPLLWSHAIYLILCRVLESPQGR